MIVDIAIPTRVSGTFHYLAAEDSKVSVGSVVEVPFGSRTTHGFVLGILESSPLDPKKLKSIGEILVGEPLFDAPMFQLLKWISDYYCHPLGDVIASAIPKQLWKPSKRTKQIPLSTADKTLAPDLTDQQKAALEVLNDTKDRKPVLLHGVTGSGKTEVYLQMMEAVLKEGRGAIVLVPEIALTPQLVGRFSARFPNQIAILHSDLPMSERRHHWQRIRSGEANIVIGARSAIFAPVQKLGLIVVDEEHETSFKQEDKLRYNARDVAVVRGSISNAKVVLGSATPSLESMANVHSGRYTYAHLKNRVLNRPMPKIRFVDLKQPECMLREDNPWLSRELASAITKTLSNGQQTLLYLNRLGFAHFLFCKDCGHTWHCKNCDVSLTYYKNTTHLKCHYCGYFEKAPNHCSECQGNHLDSFGLGTEQVELELTKIFPKARIARMDRSVIKNKADLENLLEAITQKKIDIVIGTQMLAKGHDFPGISLVGILSADASLNIPDFRAQERTFQILTQVSGRAGRAEIPGEVIIQTLNPENIVLRLAAAQDSDTFYKMELTSRKQFFFPPFVRAAMLKFQHKNSQRVEGLSREIVTFLRKEADRLGAKVQILGPAEAPIAKIKGLYRWHCLIKCDSVKDLQFLLKRAQDYVDHRKSPVQMAADVDPMHVM